MKTLTKKPKLTEAQMREDYEWLRSEVEETERLRPNRMIKRIDQILEDLG